MKLSTLFAQGRFVVTGEARPSKGQGRKRRFMERDLGGHELVSSPGLCLGAVVNPGSDEIKMQLNKMESKQ